jgi:hypothetical protein
VSFAGFDHAKVRDSVKAKLQYNVKKYVLLRERRVIPMGQESVGDLTLKTLDDLQLIKPRNRMDRILALEASDLNQALTSLESSMSGLEREYRPGRRFNPFEVWFPYPSETLLHQVPAYLLVFEKAYMVDPLFDVLVTYESVIEHKGDFRDFISDVYFDTVRRTHPEIAVLFVEGVERREETLEAVWGVMCQQSKVALGAKLNRLIERYLRNKDLLDEGSLVMCYSDIEARDYVGAFEFLYLLSRQFASFYRNDLPELRQALDSSRPEDAASWLIDRGLSLDLAADLSYLFANSSLLKRHLSPSTAPSITIGDRRTERLLNAMINLAGDLLGDNVQVISEIQWPTRELEYVIESLDGIPAQELLSVRDRERDVLDNFRHGMQQKLLDLKTEAGSDKYSELIWRLHAEQEQQAAEIQLMLDRIKKEHLRKIVHQIGTVTLSVAGTILSAAASVRDPAALVGLGLGAAGVTAAASKVVETWIDYKTKMDELKERDAYLLWKLRHP